MKFKLDGQEHDLDMTVLMAREARMIKDATALTIVEWGEALDKGDPDALIALVWLARRRNGEPDLKFADVDFNLTSFEVVEEETPEVDAGPTDPTPVTSPISLASSA